MQRSPANYRPSPEPNLRLGSVENSHADLAVTSHELNAAADARERQTEQ